MKKLAPFAMLGLLLAAGPVLAEPPAAAQKSGCMGCHSIDKKLVGPSFKSIADKNKDQADALVRLSDKVRKGGAGVWGPIPMSPNGPDKISDADLKQVIEWVLKGAS